MLQIKSHRILFLNKILRFTVLSTLAWTFLGGTDEQPASAAPTKRIAVEEHGDFVIFGNTLGQECGPGVPAPLTGTVGACGTNTSDSSPDVFWRSDEPAADQATADDSITTTTARSTAVLKLPTGATVLYARLYWAAFQGAAGSANTATFERPGVFSKTLSPESTVVVGTNRGARQ